ncbi:ABC transporter substrate-binding protein [Galactobacter caseinivorans]|nr:ABC transporter substrate-binding protein [Galactobacter caseinivorans]
MPQPVPPRARQRRAGLSRSRAGYRARSRSRAGLAVALLSAAMLLLSACTAGYTARDDAGAAPAGSLTVALTAAPSNLDFTTTSGAAIPQALMGNVYQGLVAVNEDGKLVPQLASGWQVDSSRTVYTFELQPGVTFSNGDPFNAESVKFSVERVKSAAWSNGLKSGMDVVKAVEVRGEHTVAITLSRPSQSWLWTMATLVGAQFTPNGTAKLATQAVGTGPFTVTSWKPGQSLTLTRREHYWGQPAAAPQIALRYYADPTTATNALRAGAVDVVAGMQAPDLLPGFQKDAGFKVTEGTTTGEVVMSMNNQKAPLNDVRVRRAVLHAVNRKAVLDSAWAGRGSLIGAPVPPTDPYYEDLNNAYPHDPAKARELLKQAGVDGSTITFSVPDLPYAVAAAQVVVSDLKKVGLNVKIKQQEFPAVWLDQVLTKHDYQLSVIAHVEPRDLLSLLSKGYYLGYDSSRISELAAQADAGDDASYAANMKKVVRRAVVDDAVADTLFLLPNLNVMRADVSGMPVNAPTTALDLTRLTKTGQQGDAARSGDAAASGNSARSERAARSGDAARFGDDAASGNPASSGGEGA